MVKWMKLAPADVLARGVAVIYALCCGPAVAQTEPSARAAVVHGTATEQMANGEVGQRQEAFAASINSKPLQRIDSRVNNRIPNRLDRDYSVTKSPTEVVGASLRQLQSKHAPQ